MNKVLKFILCFLLILTVFNINGLVEAVEMDETATPAILNVTVPTIMSINLDSEGNVIVGEGENITNNGTLGVVITDIKVEPKSNWILLDWNKELTEGNQQFSIAINGKAVDVNGKYDVSELETVAAKSSLNLDYDVKIPIQYSNVENAEVASVVYTIAWDGKWRVFFSLQGYPPEGFTNFVYYDTPSSDAYSWDVPVPGPASTNSHTSWKFDKWKQIYYSEPERTVTFLPIYKPQKMSISNYYANSLHILYACPDKLFENQAVAEQSIGDYVLESDENLEQYLIYFGEPVYDSEKNKYYCYVGLDVEAFWNSKIKERFTKQYGSHHIIYSDEKVDESLSEIEKGYPYSNIKYFKFVWDVNLDTSTGSFMWIPDENNGITVEVKSDVNYIYRYVVDGVVKYEDIFTSCETLNNNFTLPNRIIPIKEGYLRDKWSDPVETTDEKGNKIYTRTAEYLQVEHPVDGSLNDDEWEYMVNDTTNTITLTKYIGSNPNPIVYHAYSVPDETEPKNYYNVVLGNSSVRISTDESGKEVVTGTGPFAGNELIESVTFEDLSDSTDKKGAKLAATGGTLFAYMPNLKSVDMRFADASELQNMGDFFWNDRNLESIDLIGLKTPKLTNIGRAFNLCSSLKTLDLSSIDISKCTDLGQVFTYCESLTDLNLDNWDTSNITSLDRTFAYCSSLETLNISHFKLDKLQKIMRAFKGCSKLKTVDVSKWNVSKCTDFTDLFERCYCLNNIDVSNWDTSACVNMSGVFSHCTALETVDVSNWVMNNVTTIEWMFQADSNLKNIDVSKWNVENVKIFSVAFDSCESLTYLDTSNWNTCSAQQFVGTFRNCGLLTNLDVSNWDVSNVINFRETFKLCKSLTDLNVSNWDVSKVTNFELTFTGCQALTELDVSNWKTSNVTTFYGTFDNCSSITNLPVNNWDTSSATDMRSMFSQCSNLEELDVSKFDLSNVTDISFMFDLDYKLKALDCGNWNTSKVTSIRRIFNNLTVANPINVSGWDTSNVTTMDRAFFGCTKVEYLDVSNWDVSNVIDFTLMFRSCYSLNELDVSNWKIDNVNVKVEELFSSCYALKLLDLRNVTFCTEWKKTDMFYNDMNLEIVVRDEEQKVLAENTKGKLYEIKENDVIEHKVGEYEVNGVKWKVYVLNCSIEGNKNIGVNEETILTASCEPKAWFAYQEDKGIWSSYREEKKNWESSHDETDKFESFTTFFNKTYTGPRAVWVVNNGEPIEGVTCTVTANEEVDIPIKLQLLNAVGEVYMEQSDIISVTNLEELTLDEMTNSNIIIEEEIEEEDIPLGNLPDIVEEDVNSDILSNGDEEVKTPNLDVDISEDYSEGVKEEIPIIDDLESEESIILEPTYEVEEVKEDIKEEINEEVKEEINEDIEISIEVGSQDNVSESGFLEEKSEVYKKEENAETENVNNVGN